jgi:hypothetical protein
MGCYYALPLEILRGLVVRSIHLLRLRLQSARPRTAAQRRPRQSRQRPTTRASEWPALPETRQALCQPRQQPRLTGACAPWWLWWRWCLCCLPSSMWAMHRHPLMKAWSHLSRGALVCRAHSDLVGGLATTTNPRHPHSHRLCRRVWTLRIRMSLLVGCVIVITAVVLESESTVMSKRDGNDTKVW